MAKKKKEQPKTQEQLTKEFFEREREEYEARTGETVRYPDTEDYPDNGHRAIQPEEEPIEESSEEPADDEPDNETEENQSETEGDN